MASDCELNNFHAKVTSIQRRRHHGKREGDHLFPDLWSDLPSYAFSCTTTRTRTAKHQETDFSALKTMYHQSKNRKKKNDILTFGVRQAAERSIGVTEPLLRKTVFSDANMCLIKFLQQNVSLVSQILVYLLLEFLRLCVTLKNRCFFFKRCVYQMQKMMTMKW